MDSAGIYGHEKNGRSYGLSFFMSQNNKMHAPRTFYYHELGFWCQKVAHNLAIVKLHKVGTRFVTLGEN